MASTVSSVGRGIDRKSLRRPDHFLTVIGNFFGGLEHNTTLFMIALGVLLSFGVGAAFYFNRESARAASARNALYLANQALDQQLHTITTQMAPSSSKTDSAKKGDEKEKKANEAKQAQEAKEALAYVRYHKWDVDSQLPDVIQKFKTIDQDFNGTRAAFESRLKLGDLYFNHGDSAKAVAWYQKAADSAPGSFEKTLALSSLGYADENLGKFADAIQIYQKAIQLGEGSLKGDLLLAIARCYETLHDSAKARSTYDQILAQLPNTEYSKSAEIYKNRL